MSATWALVASKRCFFEMTQAVPVPAPGLPTRKTPWRTSRRALVNSLPCSSARQSEGLNSAMAAIPAKMTKRMANSRKAAFPGRASSLGIIVIINCRR